MLRTPPSPASNASQVKPSHYPISSSPPSSASSIHNNSLTAKSFFLSLNIPSSLTANSGLDPVVLIDGLDCACSRRFRLSAAAVRPPQAEGDAMRGDGSEREYFLCISIVSHFVNTPGQRSQGRRLTIDISLALQGYLDVHNPLLGVDNRSDPTETNDSDTSVDN